ncbi:MAG: rod shape-determining protein MreC [Burkholderiales bacterium]
MEYAPPPFFKRGPSALARLVFFALLSIALIVADARFRYLEPLRAGVAVMLYPVQRAVLAPFQLLGSIGGFFSSQSALKIENARLAEQRMADTANLQRLEALEAENAHLRALLEARGRQPGRATAAEVLYSGRDPFTRRVVIDKGAEQGLRRGAPAVDNLGVVGQVTRVHPWVSEVTLITDREQLVPVQNLRNGLRAVLAGTGNDGRLELKFIPLNADFQNGDRLVTSGIDGTYPPGLPVAEVSAVERDPAALFARIVCKPTAGVSRHTQVLVLDWQPDRPAAPPAEEAPVPKRGKARKGG